MAKTLIYFIRHGEVHNPKQILYGRLPGFSLSDNGIKKVKESSLELKNKGIEFLYTSPMRRTRQTSQILSSVLGLKPKISRLLVESKLLHTGISLVEFKQKIQPTLYQDKYIKLGQESVEAQGKRMERFVKIMEKIHPGRKILAVSHGDPIVILKARLLKIPFSWQFKKENYVKPGFFILLTCLNGRYSFY